MATLLFIRGIDVSGTDDPVDLRTAGYIFVRTIERMILEIDAEKFPRFYCTWHNVATRVFQVTFWGLTEDEDIPMYASLIDSPDIYEGETAVEQKKIREKQKADTPQTDRP